MYSKKALMTMKYFVILETDLHKIFFISDKKLELNAMNAIAFFIKFKIALTLTIFLLK
jgi:hypothetical protein